MFDLTVQDFDGEPRMRDIDIAEALGFERVTDVRYLIQRHAATLASFGELFIRTVCINAAKGRPSKESWLNEHQAFYLCTQSKAKRAVEVTRQIINVFVAWRNDRLEPPRAEPVGGRPLTSDMMMDVISLVREARLTLGRTAGQVMWRKMGMPDLPVDDSPPPVAPGSDFSGDDGILPFLQQKCLITGRHSDFTRSRDVYAAYAAFMVGGEPLGTRALAGRLCALSQAYRCPSSGARFWHAKSNNTGWRGLRLIA